MATTYDNGTVTVTVSENGTGVENVSVAVDGEIVGTTGADGSLTFEPNATDELELELWKGEFEGELKFAIHDGSLIIQEEAYEYPEVESEDEHADDDDEHEDDEPADDEDDEDEEQADADEDDERED